MNIFLSYAKADTYDLAIWLDKQFNSMPSVTCWVDRDLSPGYYWAHQIQIEIQKCDVMVVLVSPDVNRVPDDKIDMSFVLKEVGFAQSLRKKIVPILAQETFIPIVLQGLHYIDLTGSKVDIGKEHLLEHIQELADRYDNNTLVSEDRIRAVPEILVAELDIPESDVSFKLTTELPLVLPQPFEWMLIPAGQVVFGKGGYIKEPTTLNVEEFFMAKYPITVGQYAAFMGKDFDTIQADHPVTNVNWFNAIKFCQWLGEQTNLSIALPMEQQWLHAAQGDDGRRYPWGNEFDRNRCNTKESGIGATTPVTQYPSGVSPYGVMDMSGNVREWMLTDYQTGRNDIYNTRRTHRVLRGGSWNSRANRARCSARTDWNPITNSNYGGFRIACNPR